MLAYASAAAGPAAASAGAAAPAPAPAPAPRARTMWGCDRTREFHELVEDLRGRVRDDDDDSARGRALSSATSARDPMHATTDPSSHATDDWAELLGLRAPSSMSTTATTSSNPHFHRSATQLLHSIRDLHHTVLLDQAPAYLAFDAFLTTTTTASSSTSATSPTTMTDADRDQLESAVTRRVQLISSAIDRLKSTIDPCLDRDGDASDESKHHELIVLSLFDALKRVVHTLTQLRAQRAAFVSAREQRLRPSMFASEESYARTQAIDRSGSDPRAARRQQLREAFSRFPAYPVSSAESAASASSLSTSSTSTMHAGDGDDGAGVVGGTGTDTGGMRLRRAHGSQTQSRTSVIAVADAAQPPDDDVDASDSTSAATTNSTTSRSSARTSASSAAFLDDSTESSSSSSTSSPPPSLLPPDQLLALEQENAQLQEQLCDNHVLVKQSEQKVAQIAEMLALFTTKVTEQEEQINHIYDATSRSTYHVQSGIQSLRSAAQRGVNFRFMLLFTIILLSFTLLLFDWYHS